MLNNSGISICAGIVLYNPDINKLQINIESCGRQCDKVIVIDNGSANENEIIDLVNHYPQDIELILNGKNYGVGHALNQILDYAARNGYDWYLTLDQDSECKPGLIKKYRERINSCIGQITCNIEDRNVGCTNVNGLASKENIECCITSGALNNTLAACEVDGYEERLFIDGIDIDFSLKLYSRGYKIIKICEYGLIHELGDGRNIELFGRKIVITRHSPIRNYYTRRNYIYIARKHYKGFRKFTQIFKQIIVGILLSIIEENKIERFVLNMRGIFDGLRMSICIPKSESGYR